MFNNARAQVKDVPDRTVKDDDRVKVGPAQCWPLSAARFI